ncbi:hypothetical protein KKA14_21475 [bacterium]|nr:hypothetical protein [bacterium]
MNKPILCCLIFVLLISNAFAADGFSVFEFGDSVEMTLNKGKELCRFGEMKKDTRWLWKSYLDCSGFKFKEGIHAKLFFQFSDDQLVKIYVVSKDINDYFLIRYPEHNYLVPLVEKMPDKRMKNLADELLFQDKIHILGNEYRYLTFYYKGGWEWEYLYEKRRNKEDEKKRKQKQLENEVGGGLTGWSGFNFDDTSEMVKQKLNGMCSSIKVSLEGQKGGSIRCNDFEFFEKKIIVMFGIADGKLVTIELKLEQDWYQVLVPLLKKKYGLPYVELTKNELYFPYLEFPKVNLVLSHFRDSLEENKVQVSLKYRKEGFLDPERVKDAEGKKENLGEKKERKLERIMDRI